MPSFFSLPIRMQMFVLVLLMAIPAVGFIYYYGVDQRKDSIKEVETDIRQLVISIASEQQHQIAAIQQLGNALAQLPQIKRRDVAALQPILAEIVRLNPQYNGIAISDKKGNVLVTTIPYSGFSFSIADRLHFKKTIASKQFSSGEYVVGKISGKPTLYFGYPVLEKGECCAVIGIGVNLEHYKDLFEKLRYPPGANFVIVDHRGVIINTGLERSRYIGKQDKPELFQGMKEGGPAGSFTAIMHDGVERTAFYSKITLTGEQSPFLYIRAGFPVKPIIEKANRKLIINIGIMTFFLLLSLFLAHIVGTRSIVDRIADLKEVAGHLAAGDLHARASNRVTGGDLGSLAQSLDAMAEKLLGKELEWEADSQERQRTLELIRMSENRFRSVFFGIGTSMALMTKEGSFVLVNTALCNFFGFSEAEILGKSFIDVVCREDTHHIVTLRNSLLKGETDTFSSQIRCLHKNGTLMWGLLSASVVRNSLGNVSYIIIKIQDISDIKKAERDLLDYQEQLTQLTAELSLAEERERRRISTELHDNIGQSLSLCSIRLSSLALRSLGERESSEVLEIKTRLDEAISVIRTLISQLNPPILYEMGLEGALAWLASSLKQERGLDVTISDDGREKKLDLEVGSAIFQIVRELLINVAKHADTDRAQIFLSCEGDYYGVEVKDEGRGFDSSQLSIGTHGMAGFGLFNIRQRVRSLGGTFTITSVSDKGTSVLLEVPLNKGVDKEDYAT